jgi:hypothetical protein
VYPNELNQSPLFWERQVKKRRVQMGKAQISFRKGFLLFFDYFNIDLISLDFAVALFLIGDIFGHYVLNVSELFE